VFWGHTEVGSLGSVPVFGELELAWAAAPFTILVVVGFINAINMIDGLDGLAGGVTLVMLGWLAFCAIVLGADGVLMVIVAFAAAIGGFLWFNIRHPWQRSAKVFLGDAGSMPIGLAVAWFAIELSKIPGSGSDVGISPAAIAWILAVPVIDTISVMTRRIMRGISPFTPGRDHLHHMLLRLGRTPGQATATMMGLTAAAGAVGVLGSNAGVPDFVLLTGLFGLALAHAVGLRRARRIIVRRLEQVQHDPDVTERMET
jgi:UDP-GlcNAc:undecaprenyl-phosphate/decaprenyl-phosphate GlcNAc-1-phosphate transferase